MSGSVGLTNLSHSPAPEGVKNAPSDNSRKHPYLVTTLYVIGILACLAISGASIYGMTTVPMWPETPSIAILGGLGTLVGLSGGVLGAWGLSSCLNVYWGGRHLEIY